MVKCREGTLYIGGVEFGTVTVFDWPELDAEPSPRWPAGGLSASMTISLEYKGTKGKKGKRTNGKKLKRPLQK